MTTIRSTLLGLATGVLTCSEAGGAQQLDASAPSAEPVPGFASVDIGGRSLRYKCTGEGTPTVVIEPGGGVSLETVFSWGKPIGWAVIVPQTAKLTRVCVYDRAGLGRSDAAPLPRTSLDVAKDLHALLERADIAPPYIFVGQSFGGMNARMFASLYPQTIAGMVPPPTPGESEFLQGWRKGPDLSKSREWVDLKATPTWCAARAESVTSRSSSCRRARTGTIRSLPMKSSH